MMNAVVKPYHEMCLNSSELIVPRDTYQRALHPARVARIAKEFDERVANEPKISFRDGHYYVMDGQNTIAARKFLNGCMAWFTNAKQANIRRETYTSQLMKGERCTIERPLFISSANFQLINICLHRIKKVRIYLHTLTSQQKIR